MIVDEPFSDLTLVNLVLAGLLLLGALADLVFYSLLRDKRIDGTGSLRVLAVIVLATVGILSVLGSILPNSADEPLRWILGILRGGGILLVWTLAISDLTRYMNERVGG